MNQRNPGSLMPKIKSQTQFISNQKRTDHVDDEPSEFKNFLTEGNLRNNRLDHKRQKCVI